MVETTFEIVLFGCVNQPFGLAKQAGIHRLATEMRRYGFTVQAIDHLAHLLSLPQDQQARLLRNFLGAGTLVVGLSTTMLQLPEVTDELSFWGGISEATMKRFVQLVRSLAPAATVVLGGSQVRWPISRLIADRAIADYFVVGQGERSLLAIMNHLKYGDALHVERSIDGTQWLSDITYPYDGFSRSDIQWLANDFVQPGEVLPIEIARGCVFKCAYCAFPLTGKKWGDLLREASVIEAELVDNFTRYGTTKYIVMDDTINDSLEKVRFLHEIFTRLPFEIQWASYVRLDLIWKFPEMAQLLYEAGMRAALFGIETLHLDAGRKVGRGLGPERIKSTLDHCRTVWGDDVHISALLILGLPGEPISSMRETLDWILDPGCPVDNASFAPLYLEVNSLNSKIEKNATQFGYDISAGSYQGSTAYNWKSDITDYPTVLQLFYDFDKTVDESATSYFRSIRGWLLFSALSLGFTIEDLKTVPRSLMKQRIMERQNAGKHDYITKLCEWRAEEDIIPSTVRLSPTIRPSAVGIRTR